MTELKYKSVNNNVSHACGHDGHMAILAGLAEKISSNRPKAGKVVLLFQPAEEIEQGATRLAWFWIFYMIGVYFLYLTMTPDVTEKVLYGTAVFVILFSLMIYHRYYKVPSKYK